MADVAQMRDLLPVQELDTRATQLRYRREHLDLRVELKSAQGELADQVKVLEGISAELKELHKAQKVAEDHASLISDRADAIDRSLYDGSVKDPKELGSLQQELAQLRSNQDNFETRALEIMEEADPVLERLDSARESASGIEGRIGDLEARITVAEAEIDAELAAVAGERSSAADAVDAQMLELYEALRVQLGGIAVAELTGRRCGGCHLELPSAQAEQVRHATEPRSAVCPDCGCLLVA